MFILSRILYAGRTKSFLLRFCNLSDSLLHTRITLKMRQYEYLLTLFTIAANVSTMFCAGEYEFTTNDQVVPTHILYPDPSNMARNKNKYAFELCEAARKHKYQTLQVANDPKWSHTDTKFYQVQLLPLGYLAVSVLPCPTIPILYLLPHRRSPLKYTILVDKSGKRIKDAIPKNSTRDVSNKLPHDLNGSTVIIIEYDPITCHQILSNDPRSHDLNDYQYAKFLEYECDSNPILRMSALGELTDAGRRDLCSSAVKLINQLSPKGQQPVSESAKTVGEAKIFGIKDKNSEGALVVNKRVALACSTSPHVYVLYKNLRLYKDMLILVVKEAGGCGRMNPLCNKSH